MVSAEDDDINLVFKSHTALCNHLKQSNIDKRVHRLGTLESQGRVFQSKNIDHQLSSNYLSNLAISDSLVQFTLKSRMQLKFRFHLMRLLTNAITPNVVF